MAADIDVAAMVDHRAGDSPDKILLLEDNRMDVRLLQQLISRRQPRRSGTDDDSLRQNKSSFMIGLSKTFCSHGSIIVCYNDFVIF